MELPEHFSKQDIVELHSWQEKIEIANHNNIFCHCRACDSEWVDSTFNAICSCGSSKVERISCWQFPDD